MKAIDGEIELNIWAGSNGAGVGVDVGVSVGNGVGVIVGDGVMVGDGDAVGVRVEGKVGVASGVASSMAQPVRNIAISKHNVTN